jgi:uncharacterized membrane protein YoaK (UPF0700 family)
LKQSDQLGALQRTSVALLLTWVAGFVDLVGYEYLYGVYAAHMSGNTVAMARHISESHSLGVARNGFTIAMFVGGLILGAIVFEAERRGALRLRCPATLLLESAAIAIFLCAAPKAASHTVIPPQPAMNFYLLVALLAAAMGLQNVTIRKVGGINVYTTFITGSLVKFAETSSAWLFWMRDRTRNRFFERIGPALRISLRRAEPRRAALTGGLWTSYLAGGVCAGYAHYALDVFCLIFPLLVLIGLTLYGAISPFIHLAEPEW